MKNQTHKNLLIRSSLALFLALAIWTPIQSESSEPAEEKKMMKGIKGMDAKSAGDHKEH